MYTYLSKIGLLSTGILFFGLVAYAATFVQPTQGPPSGNAARPLHVGTENQVKEGNVNTARLRGGTLTGQNEVCIGNDCRSEWPTGGTTEFNGECSVDTLLVMQQNPGLPHSTQGRVEGSELATSCYSRLSNAQTNEGWTLISFDNCSAVRSADCAGPSYCKFIKLDCGSGIEFERGTFTQTNPWNQPHCSDNLDNDQDGLTDLQDPGCTNETDRSEYNNTNQDFQ